MGPTRQRWDLLDKYLRAKGPKRAQRGPRYKNSVRAKVPKGPKGSKIQICIRAKGPKGSKGSKNKNFI